MYLVCLTFNVKLRMQKINSQIIEIIVQIDRYVMFSNIFMPSKETAKYLETFYQIFLPQATQKNYDD